MLKKLLILSTILACAHAEITLKEISEKPASRAKNFMIWQYFKQNITPSQADKAFYQLNGVSNKLFFAYAKKSDNKEVLFTASCMKKSKLLEIHNNECLELAMSPYKTYSLTNVQREELSKKVRSKYTKEFLSIQNEPHTQKAYEKYAPSTVLTAFTATSSKYRRENLNIYLSENFINTLSKSWKISGFIKTIINDNKLDKLQKSLLRVDGVALNSQNNFFLALNHLKHSNKKEAVTHFELSLKKAKHSIDKDKNNFWLYKVTKYKLYLDALLQSTDINIYTIYAHELSNENIQNYFSSVKSVDKKSTKSLQDPFDWKDILKEIKQTPKDELFNLASSYNQKNMIPVQSFILQKANNYKLHGYLMPYNAYLKGLSNDEKALVYAIMRQESNLIPSALSRSYALGLMQLMPFVVDALSKEVDNPIQSYNEMFMPRNNLSYALKHLQWMKKSLYHPLFMAYAYNGGMGFLRRHLEKGTFNDGMYEPFLSMELMANKESREYGKKVLANYVMYKKIMGEHVSIVHLFDTLTQPKMTDRFREQG